MLQGSDYENPLSQLIKFKNKVIRIINDVPPSHIMFS